jgi:hypothetical protein
MNDRMILLTAHQSPTLNRARSNSSSRLLATDLPLFPCRLKQDRDKRGGHRNLNDAEHRAFIGSYPMAAMLWA